jgi:F-type H+-transporting ATPase subunit delta
MYARALFQAAEGRGKLDAVASQLGDLRTAVREVDELQSLLTNPEVDSRVKSDVLVQIAKGDDELVVNFLRLLVEKGRAGDIAEFADELDRLVAAAHRVLAVEITTAHELTESYFAEVLAQIESASGRKVQASRTVDPDLIGGIVLQAGSMRLDASVRGRLDRLRHDFAHARS